MLLRCGEVEQGFEKIGDNHYSAILKLPDVKPWWPHTHGTPHLYELTLVSDGVEYPLGKTGFRRIEIDRGADGEGFGLLVNGERVFCRGAVWTTADIVRLPGARADYEPLLRLAADAGMNMIRIGGTMTYETPEFFELCDELGILVWQDFMFANFDYPRNDKAFTGHVHAEVEQFLHGVQASPVAGGSLRRQRDLSAGGDAWTAAGILERAAYRGRHPGDRGAHAPGRALCAELALWRRHAFLAKRRRHALLRRRRLYAAAGGCPSRQCAGFAAESLAFAHVPQQKTLQRHLDVPAVHSPLLESPRSAGPRRVLGFRGCSRFLPEGTLRLRSGGVAPRKSRSAISIFPGPSPARC